MWVTNNNISTAPVLAGSRALINNEDQTEGYYLDAWPTYYFIDEDLVVRKYLRGYSKEIIQNYADEMLAEE